MLSDAIGVTLSDIVSILDKCEDEIWEIINREYEYPHNMEYYYKRITKIFTSHGLPPMKVINVNYGRVSMVMPIFNLYTIKVAFTKEGVNSIMREWNNSDNLPELYFTKLYWVNNSYSIGIYEHVKPVVPIEL